MARPKKEISDLRNRTRQVRLTAAEDAKFEQAAQAHNLTVSEFLRRAGLGVSLPPQVVEQKQNAQTRIALLRLGVNLNQLVKNRNSGLPIYEDEIIRLIDRINAAMDRLDESN